MFKYLVILIFAVTCGFIFLYFGPIICIGTIGLALLVLLALKRADIVFYLLFIWSSVIYGVVSNLIMWDGIALVDLFSYVDELIVLILLPVLFFKIAKYKVDKEMLKIIAAVILFTLFVTFSACFNDVAIFALVNFVSTYAKIFLIFICAVYLLKIQDIRKLIYFIFFIEIIQFVVVIVQFFTFGSANIFVGPEIANPFDAGTGLFGRYGAHIVGHFSIILLIIAVSFWIYTRKKHWIYLGLICLISFILSFTEQDYLFLLFFLFVICKSKKAFRTGLFRNIFIILLLITAFTLYKYNIGPARRYVALFSAPHRVTNIGKVRSILLSKDILLESSKNFLIGIGPGTFSSGMAAKLGGQYYDYYIGFRMKDIISTVDFWWSSFTSLIIETGLAGYLLYLSCFFLIFRRSLKLHLNNDRNISAFDRGAAFASIIIIIFVFYVSFLSNALEWVSLMFPIAIVLAYVWKRYDEIYASNKRVIN